MIHLDTMILVQDDPFWFIYESLSGTHGQALQEYLTEMYAQVVIDYHFHPDDDFEDVIDKMLDIIDDGD